MQLIVSYYILCTHFVIVFQLIHILSGHYEIEWPNERLGDSELAGDNPDQVQPMADTCRFLARHSAILGESKDWLAQCQDNVTKRDIKMLPGRKTTKTVSH